LLHILLLLALAGQAVPPTEAPPGEVIAEVRVHGNAAIAEEEVLRLADVQVGAPFDADTTAIVEKRLRASRRFEKVEVLKRFASIADPSKISLVIIVDEGDVKIEWDRGSGEARTVRRRGLPVMFLPVLDYQEGYGWTYGARFAVPNIAGARSRLAMPLTWGGDKRAAVQLEKDFDGGPLDRVVTGLSVSRREHPFYEQDDDRLRLWGRVERDLLPQLRAGATLGTEDVQFLADDTRFLQTGADLVLDTRIDPVLARNAVYARAAWDRYALSGSDTYHQYSADLRGYGGFIGQSVIVGRVYRSASDRPLPPFLQPILGGMDNLRGFKAGTAVGDTLVAGSAEVRVPITSPLNIAKLGVSAFIDIATVYEHGARLSDQRFDKGIGGSVWVTAAFFRLNFAVAHGMGSGTRVHFGTSFSY
jgi:outer membrane protein assembly factor BamA